MNNSNYTKQNRTAFLALLEQERQEMLAAGMSEADIFRMHFGEFDENGNRRKDVYLGDYAVWLSERAKIRPDHKYAPGKPQSLETIKYEGDWFRDDSATDFLLNIEQVADIESALQTLTPKQRALVRALVFDDVTPAVYAKINNLDKSTVSRNLERARNNLKKYL